MFDTVLGLPVHALVVHATVGMVPLATLATLALALLPRWRRLLGPAAVAAAAAALVLTFVARQSGQALNRRLHRPEVAQDHVQLGGKLIWFVLALLVATVLLAVVSRRGQTGPVLAVLVVAAVLAAGATGFWTVRVGHSGSKAVWRDIVESTNTP